MQCRQLSGGTMKCDIMDRAWGYIFSKWLQQCFGAVLLHRPSEHSFFLFLHGLSKTNSFVMYLPTSPMSVTWFRYLYRTTWVKGKWGICSYNWNYCIDNLPHIQVQMALCMLFYVWGQWLCPLFEPSSSYHTAWSLWGSVISYK